MEYLKLLYYGCFYQALMEDRALRSLLNPIFRKLMLAIPRWIPSAKRNLAQKGWNSMKKTIKSLLFVTIYMSAMIFITSCNQDTQVLESRRSIKFIKKENLLIFYTENNGQENTYIDTLFLKKGEYYKNYYGGQKIIYLSNKRDTVIRIPPNQINSNEYVLYVGNTKKSPYKLYKKYESAIDGDLFESSLYIVKDDYRNRENDIRLMSSFLYDKDYKMIKYLRLHYDTYE